MNNYYNPQEAERIAKARESYSGRMLTNAQFDDAMAITGVLEREIQKTGKFKDKLGDYAYALARNENFDVMKAETIIRDLYKVRTGQTMNQHREALIEREANLTDQEKAQAGPKAYEIGTLIKEGQSMPFHRAYDHRAGELALDLGITDAGAKTLMQEAFRAAETRELYEWGKELEAQYYHSQKDTEKEQRQSRQSEDKPQKQASSRHRTRA